MQKGQEPLSKWDPRKFFRQSEVPIIVYIVVLAALATALALNAFHEDLALNLFSELLGAAFTIFIIDVLLVRSKAKRWKVVREYIDYLISRDVNRIRDGLATRAFRFDPDIKTGISHREQLAAIREERSSLLTALEGQSQEEIMAQIRNTGFFDHENYGYFHEKAEDIWNMLNMKYSEYLDPELVSELIDLHTHLKDICGHIRQHQKAERFPEDKEYYLGISLKGCAVSLKKVLRIVNKLKEHGYSISAELEEEPR